jgi:two-component system LytT family sensor kinase
MDNNDNDALVFLLLVVISVCIWLYIKLMNERKERDKVGRENQQLIADNALLEAEHLKFQLQPHTLNNILANLKSIANKLNKGMDSLSETLEYILYKGHSHLVSVEDEMNFIRKYLALNDLFISEIDSIKFDSSQVNINSKHFVAPCLPHLITAYFIENAFKHGDVNHPEFLKIQIKLSETTFEMAVVNRIKQTASPKNGGLGLGNMKKRLDLLLTGKYEIKTSCNEIAYYSTLNIHF